jgi:hypothetical protein
LQLIHLNNNEEKEVQSEENYSSMWQDVSNRIWYSQKLSTKWYWPIQWWSLQKWTDREIRKREISPHAPSTEMGNPIH